MTATQLAEIVRAYLARSQEKFNTKDTIIDLVFDAINDAKRYALKDHDWFLLKQQQAVTIPTTGLDITLEANGRFKKIDYVYEQLSDGSVGDRKRLLSHLQTHDIFEQISEYYGDAYQMGKKIYIAGATQSVDVVLIGYQDLPDYVSGSVEEDIFTEYAANYLKLFAINQLQLFQKEDQRSYISDKKVRDSYMNVLNWDTSLKFPKDLRELI